MLTKLEFMEYDTKEFEVNTMNLCKHCNGVNGGAVKADILTLISMIVQVLLLFIKLLLYQIITIKV